MLPPSSGKHGTTHDVPKLGLAYRGIHPGNDLLVAHVIAVQSDLLARLSLSGNKTDLHCRQLPWNSQVVAEHTV